LKHVLIINHNAGSVHHGPNFRSYYVARALIDRGFLVTIACSSFSHKLTNPPVVKTTYAEEDVDGIRMIWLKTPHYRSSKQRIWNYLCFARRLPLLYHLIQKPVDAVICSSPPPFWIWFCKEFARKRGARLIFESRDLWPDVILETRRYSFLNPAVWLMMVAERIAYKSCDSLVSVNQEARATMESRGLPYGKFRAIQNGVTLDRSGEHRELSSAFKEQLPRDGSFCVGYAGSLSNVYGLKYLIDAARILKQEKISFVLAGGGAHERSLQAQAADLPKVIFLGWIPKLELQAFLRHMDIAYAGLLDLPSFASGSDSTKVFEYMKAKLPVVHALGSKSSVIKKSGAGLQVQPEDAQAISHAILRLRDLSEREQKKLGEKGLEYLRKSRSYDVLGQKWVDLLNSLID
jgi:glycosyltransferase involved in cell wall biosynthesis